MNKLYIFGGLGILILLVMGILFVSGDSSITFKNNPITNILGFNSKVTIENANIKIKEPSKIYESPNNFTSIKWNINKTGAEENLSIEYNQINATHTEFCIGFEDKFAYEDYYAKENNKIKDKQKDKDKIKDLKKVPIVKIKDDESKIKFPKTELDLESLASSGQDCFTLEHGENPLGLEFKIGWNSVLISSNSELNVYVNVQSPMVRLDSGRLISVFEDDQTDPVCAYSDNDGSSWTVVELAVGSLDTLNVATNGTQVYITALHTSSNDLYYITSDNGCPSSGASMTEIPVLTNGIKSQTVMDIKYDGIKDQYIMCYEHYSSGDLYFANLSLSSSSTAWNVTGIYTGIAETVFCAIDSNEYGEIGILQYDSNFGQLNYFNSSNNFVTQTRNQLTSGTAYLHGDISMDYSNISLTTIQNADIWNYFSGDNGTNFYFTELDFSDILSGVSICLEDNGLINILTTNTTSADTLLLTQYLNGTGYILNETIESSANNLADVRLLCNNYPTNNNHNTHYLEYMFSDESDKSVYFGNYVINNILTSHTSLILNSTSLTNTTNENLTLYLSGATDDDADTIHNITDWRINGSSWNVLNIPFDIEEASIKDFSTNQFSGVISGNPTYNSTGQVGGSYDFDGTGDYVNFTDGSVFNSFNGEFSVETWVNIDNFAVSGQNYIFSTCNVFNIGGFCLQVGDDHNYKFTVTNSSINVYPLHSPAIQDVWQHVVGTYNGTDIKIYVNGTLMNSSYYPSVSGNSNNGYATIGADYQGNQYFDGQISDLKVYNHSLSEEQIVYNYNQGLSGKHIDKIVSQETEVGQNWTANVTTTDLFDYGGSSLSNSLLIIAEAGADTCTYTSGNWEVDCSDNCVISSPVDVGGNNISIIGTGTFITQSAITNFEELLIRGTDSSNICEVICDGGCFEGAT